VLVSPGRVGVRLNAHAAASLSAAVPLARTRPYRPPLHSRVDVVPSDHVWLQRRLDGASIISSNVPHLPFGVESG
jgi:hypothetical protein